MGVTERGTRQNSFKTRGTEKAATEEALGVTQVLGVEIESKLPNLENEEDERDRKQEGTEQKTGTSFLEISTQMTPSP